MMDIKVFTNAEEQDGVPEWVDFFFYILLYCFINVIIKTYIGSFIVVCFILHIVNIFRFFPSPEQLHFGGKKCIISHSFWPRWLK